MVLGGRRHARARGTTSHPLAPGDVIARPPSRRLTHALTAGADGLTYLVVRHPARPATPSIYPETGKVWIRGLGVWLDAEPASPNAAGI